MQVSLHTSISYGSILVLTSKKFHFEYFNFRNITIKTQIMNTIVE